MAGEREKRRRGIEIGGDGCRVGFARKEKSERGEPGCRGTTERGGTGDGGIRRGGLGSLVVLLGTRMEGRRRKEVGWWFAGGFAKAEEVEAFRGLYVSGGNREDEVGGLTEAGEKWSLALVEVIAGVGLRWSRGSKG